MYTQLSKIQSGTFSTVYRAYDSKYQQEVALKIVEKPTQLAKAKKLAHLVAGEYDILTGLGTGHPNICALLDFHERDTCYVFVMEFAARGDLYEVIRSWKTRSEPRVQVDITRLLPQLCSAIDYAHSRGIAHRDIKPENILLDGQGNVKLADWGLSCRSRISHDSHIGTEKYLAPEAYGKPYDTFLADYWSLGITLLFVMFGACPFKSADVSKYLQNPNFAQFVADPQRFTSEYYFKPLHAGRDTVATKRHTSHRRTVSDDGPAEWLCLPQIGRPTLSREQILVLFTTNVVAHLLLVNPAARSMRAFLIRMSSLLVPANTCYSCDADNQPAAKLPTPSFENMSSEFYFPGLVSNPGTVLPMAAKDKGGYQSGGSTSSATTGANSSSSASTSSGSVATSQGSDSKNSGS
ncbi:LAME_0A06854g1_1 [Lachancea meyersii CBS 8951]|uniref:non-specific serine/threonine protein kinase n=1 Tax=Lachancea meyersii CBS 8951 TaxID=1266667 RepID=A0A1G4IQG7_9SACH|nr:LAME_0A06854g1_1 [Lachancea meyersii CBS 8951]